MSCCWAIIRRSRSGIKEGRVDCGFVRLPTCPTFEIIPLEQDRLLATLPVDHPLAKLEKVPIAALCQEPFMLLEKGAKAEISEVFERNGLTPRVHFTTWDDYAVMALVEGGLGISMLPELILSIRRTRSSPRSWMFRHTGRSSWRCGIKKPPRWRSSGFWSIWIIAMRNAAGRRAKRGGSPHG
ncbi:MAG: LysR family transcriptional regulator substrate-binding protein [Oscillospiraceae bacterium]